jgi:thiol-disulfide isomerase/thioredoxin
MLRYLDDTKLRMFIIIEDKMARTESLNLPMDFKAPDFELWNPKLQQKQSLQDLQSTKATVVMFICNHCPFVIHIADKLSELASQYIANGVSVIGINPNDVINYPADSPENMVITAEKYGFEFAYLYDETQEIAKAYKAVCTPDIYVFDSELKLRYHGQFDASRPGNNVPVTGIDLSNAIDAVLSGTNEIEMQIPSIGCNIKWKM